MLISPVRRREKEPEGDGLTTGIRDQKAAGIVWKRVAPLQPGEAPAVTVVPSACAGPSPMPEPGLADTPENGPFTRGYANCGACNPAIIWPGDAVAFAR